MAGSVACVQYTSPNNYNSSLDSLFLVMFQSSALRRFQSMPVPFCGLEETGTPEICHTKSRLFFSDADLNSPQSPHLKSSSALKIFDEDETSQDSGVSLEGSQGDFRFAEPTGRPRAARRALKTLTDDNIMSSPSTPFSLFRKKSKGSPVSSPVKLHISPLTSVDDDNDDGFLDLFDMEDLKDSDSLPCGLSGLVNAPLLHSENLSSPPKTPRSSMNSLENQENRKPKQVSFKRGLFRSPSVSVIPEKTKSLIARPRSVSFKRAEPDCDSNTPVQTKRRKSAIEGPHSESVPLKETTNITSNVPASRTIHRCFSETEAMIKKALTRRDQEPDLIGDLSRPYTLPLCKSKHQDLKGISPQTVAAVVRGEYDHLIKEAIIVDARYPYEYEGGHIKGAINLFKKEEIMKHFLAPGQAEKYSCKPGEKPTIIIFHCEFSSERAPRLSRFLRNKDRDANTDNYPFLNFPEIYLLEGGYKEFFHNEKEECIPQTYKMMLDENHAEDLRKYRAETKLYSGDSKSGRTKGRTMSFRSGLKL